MEQQSGSVIARIRDIVKENTIIRHRTDEEHSGSESECILCRRKWFVPAGALCIVLGNEGHICPICATIYAPDMARTLQMQAGGGASVQDVSDVNSAAPGGLNADLLKQYAEELTAISVKTDTLARGIARGIIEAPAGHIGLLHYAKDIQKPERRDGESEKDYELRVRSFRISHLYEKIHADTTGRILKVAHDLDRS